MDIRPILITNGVGVVLLLILCYVSRTKVLRHRMEDRVYTVMVFGVMLGCILEAFSYAIDGRLFPGAVLLNHVANTYLFTVNFLLPLCMIAYVDLGLYGDPKRLTRCYRPQFAVAVVLLAANVVNLFVPISYLITPDNVYQRLPFGYVYYVAILYYCLTALTLTRRYERENGARSFFSIGLFLLPILAGAALQSLFYGLSLAWLAAAIGLTGLFMMQQNEMAYVDSLVDLYNRQYLNRVLAAWAGRGYGVAGAMLDIDRFKEINDRFGHSEGDRALRRVGDVLKQASQADEWVFRYAGDEFVVLMRDATRADLDAFLARAEQAMAESNQADERYDLSISYGTSLLEDGDVDAFMREMDAGMYEMKARHHNTEGLAE